MGQKIPNVDSSRILGVIICEDAMDTDLPAVQCVSEMWMAFTYAGDGKGQERDFALALRS